MKEQQNRDGLTDGEQMTASGVGAGLGNGGIEQTGKRKKNSWTWTTVW